MSAPLLGAFWRLVLVQSLAEAGQSAPADGAARDRYWLAFTAGIAGIAGQIGTAPKPLTCTLERLLDYGVSVVDAVGIEEAGRLGGLAMAEIVEAMPLRADEVAAVKGKSEPASA